VPKTQKKRHARTNPLELAMAELGVLARILAYAPEPGRTLLEHHLSPFGGGMAYAVVQARDRGLCGNLGPHAYWTHIRVAREIVGLRLSKPWLVREVA
jgi:hypothetical protein